MDFSYGRRLTKKSWIISNALYGDEELYDSERRTLSPMNQTPAVLEPVPDRNSKLDAHRSIKSSRVYAIASRDIVDDKSVFQLTRWSGNCSLLFILRWHNEQNWRLFVRRGQHKTRTWLETTVRSLCGQLSTGG